MARTRLARRPLYKVLYIQVLLAVAIGVRIGVAFPDVGAALKPLGDAFIKLVRMITAPVIFCTVVTGIAGMTNLKSVSRVGAKTLGYFLAVSTLALIVGLVVANVVEPGDGLHVDAVTLDHSVVAPYQQRSAEQGFVEFLLHIIPDTAVGAFASGETLQVVLFSCYSALALR